jgi:hypothetical protein
VTFCTVLIEGLACFYISILTIDPFSTGRFTLIEGVDVTLAVRAWSNAGRARDLAFDAAIIGNSRGARFAPAQLDALTGRRFVQLSVFAIGPNEQMTIARAFIRTHGAMPAALLFALDQPWCDNNDNVPYQSFPFWLYESSDAEYLRRIFSPEGIQGAFRRVAIRVFGLPQAGPRDGFDLQEPSFPPERFERERAQPRPVDAPEILRFPWADHLFQMISAFPERTQIALVFLPYYISLVPAPNTPAAAALDACKAAFRSIAERRTNVTVFDFLRDDATARRATDFADATHAHYRLMDVLAQQIAPALRQEAR